MDYAYGEGSDARNAGLGLSDNPYDPGTSQHAQWAAGWLEE
jgi:hypothetical protein